MGVKRAFEVYLRAQKKRADFFRLLRMLVVALFVLGILFQLSFLGWQIIDGFKMAKTLRPMLGALSLGLALSFIYLLLRNYKPLDFKALAEQLEAESEFFKTHSIHRGELISAAHFLSAPEASAESKALAEAHIRYWENRIQNIRPRIPFSKRLGLLAVLVLGLWGLHYSWLKYASPSVPPQWVAWVPGAYEVKLPFEGAEWRSETGAISGIVGSRVRFKAPDFGALKSFVFIRDSHGRWILQECRETCEFELSDRGQYAVGHLFGRSSLYPLVVIADESPKGVLLARINGEWLVSPTLDVLNKKTLELEAAVSDDVLLTKVELMHRAPGAADSEVLNEWQVGAKHFKSHFELNFDSWKGGRHEIFLRMYDQFKFAESGAVTIIYADEETQRAKRMQDLRTLLDEWVHVLADLLESQQQKKLAEGLVNRLRSIVYFEDADQSLLNAYMKELKLLGDRIERWARYSPDFSEASALVQKTEKTILYGLSLLFQEKTGDIEATSQSIQGNQKDLNQLLEKIKKGELEATSKELEEAFKKLAENMEELQKKIRELPNGPNDELLNREALEAQAEESDSLLEKIEAIKKQMAAGDQKGALRELESLLNQLSILSKEMERSLDQWKSNLDRGAMQASQKYTQQLEALAKKQEELTRRTEDLKEKKEQLEEQNQKTWKPIAPEKQRALNQKIQEAEKDQKKLGEELKQAREDFEKLLEGSEMKEMLMNQEAEQMYDDTQARMGQARDSLAEQKLFESMTSQKEASELLKKMIQSQKSAQSQAQQSTSSQPNSNRSEHVEVVSSESKGSKDRKRKIMDSLKQKVGEEFQSSHEQYFEDLLQR